MTYFSQTGNIVIDVGSGQLTNQNITEKNKVIFTVPKNVFFQLPDHGTFTSKKLNIEKNKINNELSREEEDKFYKKVFKTSLL